MSDEPMSEEELEEQDGEPLPDREATSAIPPLMDPDLPVGDVPKVGEPGLPPPRD